MGNKPFFSIVIPALNEQKYLPKLLTDLTKQLDKDFEVILVDDHSEDDTVKATMAFKSSLPLIVVTPPSRKGPGPARNFGAKNANGKFLVFFDADLRIPTNYLSQIHHYLTSENPKCKLLTTWIQPDSEEQADKIIATLSNIGFEIARALEKPVAGGFNIIVERNLFKKAKGFNPAVKLAEDHELVERIHSKYSPLYILKSPKVTFSYRRLRREGRLTVLRKYALATAKLMASGPITEELFDYPMGGLVPKSRRSTIRVLSKNLKKYTKHLKSVLTETL